MNRDAASGSQTLVVRVCTRLCAVPLAHVVETMRPLPVERIAGMPSFVRGVSIIRGVPTPVVDLGVVLGTPGEAAERFVTLRLGFGKSHLRWARCSDLEFDISTMGGFLRFFEERREKW